MPTSTTIALRAVPTETTRAHGNEAAFLLAFALIAGCDCCDPGPPTCGNGEPNVPEACDLGTSGNTGGYGGCTPECQLGPHCGDGIISGPEQCDPASSPTAGCLCTSYCRTQATSCGDGVVQEECGEICDDGMNDGIRDHCGYQCGDERCGDGHVASGFEECDDSNVVDGDGCNRFCRVEFGNACIDSEPGQCHPTCGDARRASAEQCDDGNDAGGDGCSPTCTVEPGYECVLQHGRSVCATRCGDGIVAGAEECDDANLRNSDDCLNTCRRAVCGDGVRRSDPANRFQVEQCDGSPGCDDQCHTTTGDAECSVLGSGVLRNCFSRLGEGVSCTGPSGNTCVCEAPGNVPPRLCQLRTFEDCVCECWSVTPTSSSFLCRGPGTNDR